MINPLFPFDATADERAGLIFFAAVHRAPEERDEFVRRECGPDTTLHLAVEQMLKDHVEAGSFLGGNALDMADRNHAPPAEEAGAMIGAYKLLEQIGEGGCGVVWMAEQTQPVRRRVALKVIKLGMDTKQVIARFEAERQALALMDHPNISKVLDAGATGTGRPYFVMELVRGIKITDYCDRNHLPTGDRLALFNQVCQAIQHAHLKGIIHRDIKPSNILVTLHDGVPVPRVIDFGISKATTGQRLTDKTLFTSFEQFIGTPAYMSPEQAEMSGLDIDTRSDIYSLGVLLYELLTGRTPFDAKNLMAAGLDAMRRIIREEEPVRPSTCLSTMLTSDQTTVARHHQSEKGKLTHYLRGDLDWIVMKALEKDRTRRYETASAFALDIQSHLKNEPVLARPPSTGYRFRKMVRRNRLAVFSFSAVIIALVAGLSIASWMFFREKQARERSVAAEQEQGRLRERAEKQEKKAVAEAAKSRQVAQLLTDMLQGVGPSVAVGRDTKMLREILDKAVIHIAQDLKEQPEVQADLRTIVGEVYRELGNEDQAREMHKEALTIRKGLFGREHLQVAASMHNLAKTLPNTESELLNREALAVRRRLLGNAHEDVADSLVSLTLNLRGQAKYAEGETLASEAVAIMKRCFGNEHPRLATSLLALASVIGHQGRAPEAEKIHREVLAMRRQLLGEIHPDVAESYLHLAQVMEQQGKWEEGIAFASQSLNLNKKLLGVDHPGIEFLLWRIGRLLTGANRLREAEAKIREALALQRNRIGDDNHDVAAIMDFLGYLLIRQNKLPEAKTLHREFVAIFKKAGGNDHPNVAESIAGLNLFIKKTGKFSQLETTSLDSMAMFREIDGEEPFESRILRYLAGVCLSQGEFREAEGIYLQSLALRRALYGEESRNVAVIYADLATLNASKNKLHEAESLSRAGLAILGKLAPRYATHRVANTLILVRTLRQKKSYVEGEALWREAVVGGRSPYWWEYIAPHAAEAELAHLLTDWAWDERVENSKLKTRAADRAREAERLSRACLAALQNQGPAASWEVEAAYSRLLGGALVAVAATARNLTAADRESKFQEAEKLLLEGDAKMQLDPGIGLVGKQNALTRIIRLYEAWGLKDKAVPWQRKWDDLNRRIAQLKTAKATDPQNNAAKSAAKGLD